MPSCPTRAPSRATSPAPQGRCRLQETLAKPAELAKIRRSTEANHAGRSSLRNVAVGFEDAASRSWREDATAPGSCAPPYEALAQRGKIGRASCRGRGDGAGSMERKTQIAV